MVHGVLYIINTRWPIFASIQSRASNYVPNVRNKLLKQGHFQPFAPTQLVGVIFCLISSFQLNLADNYYFQEKLEIFTYKQVENSLVGGANQTFYSAAKNAKFSVFKTCKMAVAGQNTRGPPARPENYCESKQTYFSYSLDKVFHSPKIIFHAKLSGRFLLRQPLKSRN